MHNALLVLNWISNFDPENIHDCFDESSNVTPPQIADYEQQIDRDFRKIAKMKLSPSKANLNSFIRN
jgi:hypothetical protein